MRPSSSSDSNAAHRATSPVFIDFFAKEAAEQQERNATPHPQGPFAELRSRQRPDDIAAAGPSADLPVSIQSLRSFLRANGHPAGQHMHDETIQRRLNAVNLGADTLLAALQITHTPNHALLRTLGVTETECLMITNKLKAIVNNTSGFTQELMGAARHSDNNPNQLIRNFLQLVR